VRLRIEQTLVDTFGHDTTAHPAATGTARHDGPVALGPARAFVDRMANGTCHRQAGDRDRLAPTGLSAVVGLEKPAPPGTTDRARRTSVP
jgi:hypothetical protein